MMEAKREQAFVGLFVLVAAAIMIGMVFTLSGAFGGSAKTYHAYFAFAGGLEPGSTVRYAGGPKVGRVEMLRIDPRDPTRIEVSFSVQSDLPVKADSHVKIMSMSPLGDNHLEIVPGGNQSALAPAGALLTADPYVDFNALTTQINNLAPQAQQLVATLNDRATELKVTLDRVNDLLNAQNRAHLSATLATVHGMVDDVRPQLNSTLHHANEVAEKLGPVLEDFKNTSAKANLALTHIDEMIGENRPEVRQAVLQLRQSLGTVTQLVGRLDQTLDVNSENIDELLENMRHVTENLKEFTDTIKARPSTLIHSSGPQEHKPGGRP